jgi:pilus assembly protein CpaB
MNTRKIWIFAIIFGLLMSILFIALTTQNGEKDSSEQSEELSTEEIQEDKPPNNLLGLSKGKRAISIPIDEVRSVSGFIKPGSYVDIISIPDEGESHILLENVKVLAVDTRIEAGDEENHDPYSTITFELEPRDGLILATANEMGLITLMLREPTELSTEVNL